MTPPPANVPLSFRAAAEALNQPDRTGRALKALVLKREQETGAPIAHRLGGQKQPKMRVTLASLYLIFPDLKPARAPDEITKSIRSYVTAIDHRIAEIAGEKVQELVMPQFREDRARLDQLELSRDQTLLLVEQISKQLAFVTGAKKAG